MGIYGAGKAFNYEFIRRGQVSRNPKIIQKQPANVVFGGHSVTKTTNITVNNGPTGFWGFMGGFINSLFGGGLSFGGFNSFSNFGMGMGMGMPMMASPFGMLNQTQMNSKAPKSGDRLNDLKTLYPDWNIVSDGNGNYDATSKDGTVHHKGNFEQMCELLKKSSEGNDPQGKNTRAGEDDGGKDPGSGAGSAAGAGIDDGGKGTGAGSGSGSGWDAATANDLKGFTGNISVNDFASGGGASINGATVLSKPGENTQGFPAKIAVKGYQYEFQSVDSDGKAIYKSMNGKGDTYKLEKQGDSFGLNQHEGDSLSGVGSIDIGGASSAGSVNKANKSSKTPNSKPVNDNKEIKRNNDGSVTVTIGVPYKNTGTVTLKPSEIKGLNDEQIKELAEEKIKEQKTPKLQVPKFSNFSNIQ